MSSEGDASCGGVVRLEAGVMGANDGSPLLLEPRLCCGTSGGGGRGSPWCAACSSMMKLSKPPYERSQCVSSWRR